MKRSKIIDAIMKYDVRSFLAIPDGVDTRDYLENTLASVDLPDLGIDIDTLYNVLIRLDFASDSNLYYNYDWVETLDLDAAEALADAIKTLIRITRKNGAVLGVTDVDVVVVRPKKRTTQKLVDILDDLKNRYQREVREVEQTKYRAENALKQAAAVLGTTRSLELIDQMTPRTKLRELESVTPMETSDTDHS